MTKSLTDITYLGQSAFNFWIVTSVPLTLPEGVVALDIEGGRMYYVKPSTGQIMEVKLNPKVA